MSAVALMLIAFRSFEDLFRCLQLHPASWWLSPIGFVDRSRERAFRRSRASEATLFGLQQQPVACRQFVSHNSARPTNLSTCCPQALSVGSRWSRAIPSRRRQMGVERDNPSGEPATGREEPRQASLGVLVSSRRVKVLWLP